MKKSGWRDMPIGGTIGEAGSSVKYETGTWRTTRPLLDLEHCSHCMICWIFCPDAAISVKNRRVTGIDLMHCKGCGICAVECPRKAIIMKAEASLRGGD